MGSTHDSNRFPRTLYSQSRTTSYRVGFEITDEPGLSIIELLDVESSCRPSKKMKHRFNGPVCLLGEADRSVSHCSIGPILIQVITMSEVRTSHRVTVPRPLLPALYTKYHRYAHTTDNKLTKITHSNQVITIKKNFGSHKTEMDKSKEKLFWFSKNYRT